MLRKLIRVLFFIVAVKSQPEERNTTIVCDPVKCSNNCQYGFIKDKNGCPTCQCVDPCCNYGCPYGQQCEVEPLYCIWQPCGYIRKCVPCKEPICPQDCRYGFKLDDGGCKTCDCIDPCESYSCQEDEHCVKEPVSCRHDFYCGVRRKCVKNCPDIMCELYCPYGFQVDCDNCQICKCNDICENVFCPKFHYCSVNQIFCLIPPCPEPEPICNSYCKDRHLLLKDGNPVTCNVEDSRSCGANYTCNSIEELNISVCCGDLALEQ